MAGSGQTAAAEAGGLEAEIAAIFLDDDIGRQFRRAEQAVQAIVDAHRLVDAVRRERMLGTDLPTRFLLDERQQVGRVAIDLVGAGEDEDRIGAVEAGRLEQVERAVGVDGEIDLRIACRPIMRRLSRGMDDRVDRGAILGEGRVHQLGVADVAVDMAIALDLDLEPLAAPRRARVIAEEDAPHVVVDADDIEPLRRQEADRLGPDQPGRSRYNNHAHFLRSPAASLFKHRFDRRPMSAESIQQVVYPTVEMAYGSTKAQHTFLASL